MKKNCQLFAGLCIFMLASAGAFCQTSSASLPPWVSDRGYWVLESHGKHAREHTLRFYDNDHRFIASKEFSGLRLNVKRTKLKIRFKEMLESALREWAIRKQAGEGVSK